MCIRDSLKSPPGGGTPVCVCQRSPAGSGVVFCVCQRCPTGSGTVVSCMYAVSSREWDRCLCMSTESTRRRGGGGVVFLCQRSLAGSGTVVCVRKTAETVRVPCLLPVCSATKPPSSVWSSIVDGLFSHLATVLCATQPPSSVRSSIVDGLYSHSATVLCVVLNR